MSTGDFAAELRQSVEDHIALIRTAATAAKAKIGQSIPSRLEPAFAVPADVPEVPVFHDDPTPRPAVNFFAEEPAYEEPSYGHAGSSSADDPAFAAAFDAPPAAEPMPEGAITFDDDFASNVDDEGIPVWEDAP